MRRRPTPPTLTSAPMPSVPDPAASASGYDWARFGRHRFRTPGAVVVDSPLGRPGRGGWPRCGPTKGFRAGGAGCSGSPTPPTGGVG